MLVNNEKCPVCDSELEKSDNAVLPISAACTECKKFSYNYHGMGDTTTMLNGKHYMFFIDNDNGAIWEDYAINLKKTREEYRTGEIR